MVERAVNMARWLEGQSRSSSTRKSRRMWRVAANHALSRVRVWWASKAARSRKDSRTSKNIGSSVSSMVEGQAARFGQRRLHMGRTVEEDGGPFPPRTGRQGDRTGGSSSSIVPGGSRLQS